METVLQMDGRLPQQEAMPLQKMVSRLVAGIIPTATRNRSFLINDIPPGLQIIAPTAMVATVLTNLFTVVASNTRDSCIRITAKVYHNVILVQVRNRNSPNSYTLAHSLQPAQPIAEKIGGYLGVTTQLHNETTIVFSFPNLPAAA